MYQTIGIIISTLSCIIYIYALVTSFNNNAPEGLRLDILVELWDDIQKDDNILHKIFVLLILVFFIIAFFAIVMGITYVFWPLFILIGILYYYFYKQKNRQL